MIYDLWIINDLKSLKSNQPNFDLRFRFLIQLLSDLAEHWIPVSFPRRRPHLI